MRTDTQVDWIETNGEMKPRRGTPFPERSQRPRTIRIPHALPVHFSTTQHGDFTGMTRDLSSGGLALVANELLPPRTRTRLVIDLPGGPTEPMDGVVRWVHEQPQPEMGIALEYPDRRLGALLARPTARLAPGLFVPQTAADRTGSLRRSRLTRRPRQLLVRFGEGRQMMHAVTVDLSPSGIGLRAVQLPLPGTEVRLEIKSGAGVARVEGHLVWVEPASPGDPCMRGGLLIERASEEFFALVLQDPSGPRVLPPKKG